MVEKSDEFEEFMLNCESFPYQYFVLRKSRYCIFYGYNLLTLVCQDLSHYQVSGHGMLKYFHHKKDSPEDKDSPEGKELSNLSGPYLSKVIPPSSSWSIVSCNADVTRVLKQAKCSFTLNCYTKLTPTQKYEIHKYSTLASTL